MPMTGRGRCNERMGCEMGGNMKEIVGRMWHGASDFVRRWVSWRLVIPAVLGVLFGVGDDVTTMGGTLNVRRPMLYGKMLVFIAMFSVAFIVAERLFRVLTEHERLHPRPSIMFRWTRASVILGAAGIALCWLPYLAMLYPGVYWSDTSRQLVMYYGGEPIMDQHPFLDTYLFGWFADLGQLLFSDKTAGLFVLIAFQACAMSVLFSLSVSYIRRIGGPRWFCWATYAVIALFPLFPIMFSSLAKDTINAVFLLPFVIMVVEIVRSRGACLSARWFDIVLVIDALLTCLTKKTGVYIVVVALLLLCALKLRAYARGLLAGIAAGIAVVMFVLVPQCLFPMLHIEPGGKQEMIPFVAQQLAHDLKYEGESFGAADRAIVDGFFEYDSEEMAERYEPFQADAVKGMFCRDESSLADVLALWARKTVEHPVGHLEAWAGIAQGWISFRSADSEPGYLLPYFASNWFDERVTEYVQWPQESVRNHAVQTVYETVRSIPVVNVLFFRAFWATIVPFFLCYMACGVRRGARSRSLLVVAPVVISTATLFIAGVSGAGGEPTRYVFSSIIMIPVIAGYVLGQDAEDGCGVE